MSYETDDKMVSHPDHYKAGKFEIIDVREEVCKDLSGVEAICTDNALRYICRWHKKNGVQDVKKAIWYLQHLVDHLESQEIHADPACEHIFEEMQSTDISKELEFVKTGEWPKEFSNANDFPLTDALARRGIDDDPGPIKCIRSSSGVYIPEPRNTVYNTCDVEHREMGTREKILTKPEEPNDWIPKAASCRDCRFFDITYCDWDEYICSKGISHCSSKKAYVHENAPICVKFELRCRDELLKEVEELRKNADALQVQSDKLEKENARLQKTVNAISEENIIIKDQLEHLDTEYEETVRGELMNLRSVKRHLEDVESNHDFDADLERAFQIVRSDITNFEKFVDERWPNKEESECSD